MTRRIDAGSMLRSARTLAGEGSGRGRPPLSDLRRATSTAYYALFHQILRHGAINFLIEASEAEIAEIARWFTHKGVHDGAEMVLAAASPEPLDKLKQTLRPGAMAIRTTNGGVVPDELQRLADAFITLQSLRHSADYDGNYDPVRATTLSHVDMAEDGLEAAWSLWRSRSLKNEDRRRSHDAYRIFLRIALLRSGGLKAR